MPEIYFIPGLGANHLLFQKQAEAGISFKVLEYIPAMKGESLDSYVRRFAQRINDKENCILLGVSFGAMIATEIANIMPVQKVINISGIKTMDEIPFYFKILKFFKLQFLLPSSWIMQLALLARPIFGAMHDAERKIFTDIIKTTDPEFVKWAVDKIVSWTNKTIPSNYLHIHGSKDLIFPVFTIQKPYKKIKGGGHFMIVTHAFEINKMIKKVVSEPN
ncbi:MAG TPA: alpha/beta hydrolase [Cytophagaceae bacterium]